jgi:hypothetical protein
MYLPYYNILADSPALPGISWTLIMNSLEAVCSFPFTTSTINRWCRYICGYKTVA